MFFGPQKTTQTPNVSPRATEAGVLTPETISLGTDVSTGLPFTFPKKNLVHMHIRGKTRSGKSSLTLVSLIYQLLLKRNNNLQHPLFVFDLKGDTNLFHHAKQASKNAGRVFKYLVVDAVAGLDTYHFPPFQMLPPENQNVLAMAETLTQAFGMEHGPVYGGAYYSQQNLGALLQVAKELKESIQDATFSDVSKYLRKHKKEFRDAAQVEMTFSFLTETPSLAAHKTPARNIDLRQAITGGDVVYIWARTMRQAMTARLVAGLVLFSLIAVAQEMSTLGEPFERIYVLIDEFQELVSASFADIMAQSGAWMSLILANQSTSQLKNRDVSLADFVAENASIRQYFTCRGIEDIEDLQSESKDKIRTLGGSSVSGLSTSVSFKDTIVPTLERDQILEVSNTFGRSLVILDGQKGHNEPFIIQQTHEYPDLSHLPMPRLVAPKPPVATTEKSAQAPRDAEREAKLKALDDRIRLVIRKKAGEEAWAMLPRGKG